MVEQEVLLHLFHAGRFAELRRSSNHSPTVFGGPLQADVEGVDGEARLHHVATIAHEHLQVLGLTWRFSELPLVYGLAHSDCRLHYTFSSGMVRVERLEPPTVTIDWPYPEYPRLLPFVPLELASSGAETWSSFRSRHSFLSEDAPDGLVAVVPAPATLGFSLWGRDGDAEGTKLVFACDLESQRVSAHNVCA